MILFIRKRGGIVGNDVYIMKMEEKLKYLRTAHPARNKANFAREIIYIC